MTSEPSHGVQLAYYWSKIRSLTAQRATTGEIWDNLKTQAAAEGFTHLIGGLDEMNRLRGIAGGLRRAGDLFARARGDAPIESSMFAPDISARSLPGLSITPTYRVQYQQTIMNLEGQLDTRYRILSILLQLPATKDILLAEIEADAAQSVAGYGELHIAVGRVEIAVV